MTYEEFLRKHIFTEPVELGRVIEAAYQAGFDEGCWQGAQLPSDYLNLDPRREKYL